MPIYHIKLMQYLSFLHICKKDNILDYLDIFIKKIKKKSNINLTKLRTIFLIR